MNPHPTLPRNAGIFLWPWLLIVCMIGCLLALLNYANQNTLAGQACKNNLQQIFHALELYEMDRGHLPRLSFYPERPLQGNDSLRVVLEPYRLPEEACVCPKAHSVIRDYGLSYLWNMELNGKSFDELDSPQWMLIDMQALSGKVSPPHFGKYQILHTDGTIERTDHVPRSVRVKY